MEDWAEAWIGGLGLGSAWSDRWKRSRFDRRDGFVGGMGGEVGEIGWRWGWVGVGLAAGL